MNIIHFIGYSAAHPSTFHFDMVNAPGQYTLLLVSTPVQFLLDGQWVEYPAGTAMFYAPGQTVSYRACTETYENDWIRFSSEDPLVTQFPMVGVPFPVSDPEYCHHLFMLLTWETSFATADSDLAISHLLQVLFLRLRQDTAHQEKYPHASALLRLRKEIYNSPQLNWNIQAMAKELHLSNGYLQILYKKMFGTSCMDDVITSRIRLAKEQLTYSEKTISEIAELCGYHNVEHFCRQFRRQTGNTPGAFRRRTLMLLDASGDFSQQDASVNAGADTVSVDKSLQPAVSQPHSNVAGSDMPPFR